MAETGRSLLISIWQKKVSVWVQYCIYLKMSADVSDKVDTSVFIKNYPVTSLKCNWRRNWI